MQTSAVPIAAAAAVATVTGLGFEVDDALVLHDSNKLTLRLRPCEVLARVAPAAEHVAPFELDLAQKLAAVGSPVGTVEPRTEPRVHERDGYVVTLWTYYEPGPPRPPADYAHALERLHAGMRAVEAQAPHFLRRVEQAQRLVADRDLTPDLAPADRDLLAGTLSRLSRQIGESGAPEQLLHGEPHPGNLLSTTTGLRFVDFETCCRGPVEFDLAHVPEEVAEHYRGLDTWLLRRCRSLVLAMITAWRWDRNDQLPNGRLLAEEWITDLRTGMTEISHSGGGTSSADFAPSDGQNMDQS